MKYFYFLSKDSTLLYFACFSCLRCNRMKIAGKLLFKTRDEYNVNEQSMKYILNEWKKEEMENWGDKGLPSHCNLLLFYTFSSMTKKNLSTSTVSSPHFRCFHATKNLLKQTYSKSLNYILISLLATYENY